MQISQDDVSDGAEALGLPLLHMAWKPAHPHVVVFSSSHSLRGVGLAFCGERGAKVEQAWLDRVSLLLPLPDVLPPGLAPPCTAREQDGEWGWSRETPAQGLGLSWSEGRDMGSEERRLGQEPGGKSRELRVSVVSLPVAMSGVWPCALFPVHQGLFALSLVHCPSSVSPGSEPCSCQNPQPPPRRFIKCLLSAQRGRHVSVCQDLVGLVPASPAGRLPGGAGLCHRAMCF